jgi:hypothetical protein
VAPSGGADATLDVRGLTLLLAGAARPADLRRLGWVEGDGRALATRGGARRRAAALPLAVDRF